MMIEGNLAQLIQLLAVLLATNTGQKHYVGNNGVDDDSEILGNTDACTQSFLWIHQEKWQRDLLVKFGNTITLISATCKI